MRTGLFLTLSMAVLLQALPAHAAPFEDPLATPARQSGLAAKGLINGLARAGERLVAVGQGGHILLSDDAGRSWQQASSVPVSSDLLAVHFPTAQAGWAVGHDGVILHSHDGGRTWVRQLDGKLATDLLPAYYGKLAKQGRLGPAAAAAETLREIESLAARLTGIPLLDVWFSDEKNGFAVGAFNLIYRTRDGGQSWEPWLEHTANPSRLHLYSIRQSAAGLFVAGEQGVLMKLNPKTDRFVALDAGYRGSFFGLAAQGRSVFVFGLRGHLFRSDDGGSSWQKVEAGLRETITAAGDCAQSGLIFAGQSGRLVRLNADGRQAAPLRSDKSVPVAALLCAGDRAVVGGTRGLAVQALNNS
jgi:photosystem II stability/assembly factor-like uncharacterized protein